MLRVEELGPELEEAMRRNRSISPSDMPHAEVFEGMIGSHPTSSPGTIIPVLPQHASSKQSSLVKKVGRDLWLLGNARTSTTRAAPGDIIDLEVTLFLVFGPKAEARRTPRQRPMFGPSLHRLFDQDGRQRSPSRQPISDVLTPARLPIETHGEVMAEPRPDGRKEWNLGGTGLPVPWHFKDRGAWRIENDRQSRNA